MIEVSLQLKNQEYMSREAYKMLRTNIALAGVENKVMVLTSCTPGEGKSSVTINLARSLSQAGKSVLVIDADLRKSMLMGRYMVRQQLNGLSHYLSGQVQLEDVLCKTDAGFHIIFAGAIPPNPAELLESAKFEALISGLRKYYDYILIDTPPVGNVIDSVIVSRISDAAIFVMQVNAISFKYARQVKAQIEKSGCKIIGVVLNKAEMKKHKYGKYGKYGRYGKYGKYGKYGVYGEY